MADERFSVPRQWEDWASWIVGFWLLISPWALHFDLDVLSTRNAVISGFVVIVTEVVELSIFRGWEEWINVGLGAWLVASPWILGISGSAATADFVVCGFLVLALAIYEIRSATA